jgi:hypothetical protein
MIDDVVKRLMYGNKNNDMTKFKEKAVVIKEKAVTRDSVLLEINGRKHQVPTHLAYSRLLKEHTTTQNDLLKAQNDIKRLTETVKKLDSALKTIEVILMNKADKYE